MIACMRPVCPALSQVVKVWTVASNLTGACVIEAYVFCCVPGGAGGLREAIAPRQPRGAHRFGNKPRPPNLRGLSWNWRN